MKDSILLKLESIKERHEEISAELSDPDVINNQNEYTKLSKEYAQLSPIVSKFNEHLQAVDDLDDWFNTNKASALAAISEPAKSELTGAQIALLSTFIIERRWLAGA